MQAHTPPAAFGVHWQLAEDQAGLQDSDPFQQIARSCRVQLARTAGNASHAGLLCSTSSYQSLHMPRTQEQCAGSACLPYEAQWVFDNSSSRLSLSHMHATRSHRWLRTRSEDRQRPQQLESVAHLRQEQGAGCWQCDCLRCGPAHSTL